MLKSIVKALGLIAGLALSGVACAMGMGGINVATSLGEPLRAEIELVAVGKAEKNSLSAHLASPAIFKGAGMDYPSGLPTLKFQIETRANGESYIKVTSIQPVNEPFVSVLVELSWSSGRLLREYTFLLDPPGYKAEQPKAAEVKPVTPSVEAAPSIVTAPIQATAPMDEKVVAETATPAPDRKSAGSSNVASGVIKVKRGDTLSEIARQTKPSDVSLERMLVALYRSNAEAFDGKNMNRLKTGKILHMPASQDLDKLVQVDAVKEIRVQVADWHVYRQKLAAASGAVAEHAPQQEASGKISTMVADKAPAAKESSKEVVRLSKGEAPGDKAVTAGDTKALQNKVHALEEEAIAKGKALKESNERVAMLEKNIKEMQHLIELKGQPVASAKPVLGKAEEPANTKPIPKPEPAKVEAKPPTPAPAVAPVAAPQPPAAPAVTATSAVAPASAVKPAKPVAKPVAVPKEVPPPPSMLDEPLYLAGGAAALLALGGLGFMLARRGKGGKSEKKISGSSKAPTEDVGVASGRMSAPVAPSPETGDFTQAATATPISPMQPEDVDPINEADLFLSFGRDAQAEEILKDALEKNPASNQIRLKLLSIYANRKDAKSFSVIARPVQDSGDAAAWAQAAEMGRNLESNNPMYGGKGGEPVIAAPVDQGESELQPAAGLDFDLGVGAPAAAATESESTMVFNAPQGEKTMAMPSADLHTTETLMDFDITSTHPSLVAITEEKSAAEAADVSAGADEGLAFTLDFPIADKPAAPAQAAAKEAVDIDLSGISLDLGEPTAPVSAPAAEVKDAHWHDVATKLDLAKAYQEMGDNAGAREILEEVLAEGDEQQRASAEGILQQLLA